MSSNAIDPVRLAREMIRAQKRLDAMIDLLGTHQGTIRVKHIVCRPVLCDLLIDDDAPSPSPRGRTYRGYAVMAQALYEWWDIALMDVTIISEPEHA